MGDELEYEKAKVRVLTDAIERVRKDAKLALAIGENHHKERFFEGAGCQAKDTLDTLEDALIGTQDWYHG